MEVELKEHQIIELMRKLNNSLLHNKNISLQTYKDVIFVKETNKELDKNEFINLLCNILFNKPFNWIEPKEEYELYNLINQANNELSNIIKNRNKERENNLKKVKK